MTSRVYRCRHDRRLAGVAAGLAEYLDVDVTLVRLAFVVSLFFGGLGFLAYVLLAIVVPLEPEGAADRGDATTLDGGPTSADVSSHLHRHRPDGLWLTILGVILIACGANALLDLVVPGSDRFFWPAAVVVVGVALVAVSLRRRSPAA
ncbi:MAG TPA: PspC domain-containing protein [Candidatus Dormibacteraeota bacterium]|nr:PspC domain-containing protein [Candidatus Dormibacteraeota bacterium]